MARSRLVGGGHAVGDVRLDLRDEVFHGTRTSNGFVTLAAHLASQWRRQGLSPREVRSVHRLTTCTDVRSPQ
ncbi:hypothetical protein AMK11_09920 [Streptomyces sp. CB02414]|nr:hypothetical protein AMK11_09920 [Streptomyces sp. CB02414]